MEGQIPKPKKRSRLRLYLGAKYYTLRRRITWLFGGVRFARKSAEPAEYRIFSHSTPLLRKLAKVDMSLQRNKIVNLKIAAEKLDKVALRPGEVFSYWRLIGKPTKRKGYLDGMILKSGRVSVGTGGGLCQLSNLIYWMTLHTPLTVIERHRHSYDVFPDSNRSQPFGSGATCYYNYVDLQIRNDTDEVFQLSLNVTDTELHGEWRSSRPCGFTYAVYEREHFMRSEYWGACTRHNILFRRKFDSEGGLAADEYITENHAVMMYSPFLSGE